MDNNFLDHYAFARRYALKLCGDPSLAADIVQQVYLKLCEKNINIPDNNYRGYLTICVKNTLINHCRKNKNKKFIDIGEHLEMADRHRDNFTMSDSVRMAIDKINPDFKITILLCFVYGYSYKEVSALCKIPMSTVKSRIFRGTAQIKQQLQK
jgi:RNA polymerase sigma-70 factor (ECF subfamily)